MFIEGEIIQLPKSVKDPFERLHARLDAVEAENKEFRKHAKTEGYDAHRMSPREYTDAKARIRKGVGTRTERTPGGIGTCH